MVATRRSDGISITQLLSLARPNDNSCADPECPTWQYFLDQIDEFVHHFHNETVAI